MSETMKTYVALILDKSNSMNSIRTEARNNFNEQLTVLKEESNSPEAMAKKVLMADDPQNVSDGVETRVSVITFNQKVDEVDFDVNVDDITEITEEEYKPDGMTALYDAIGLTIDKFVGHYDLSDPNTGVLFVIVTDGEENSSEEYKGEDGRKRLRSKIDELTDSGKWTFTFLGTENALDQAQELGIRSSLSFDATNEGISSSMMAHSSSTRSYYSTRKKTGVTAVSDFYGTDEDKDED